MLRRIYDWTLNLASHRRAGWALGFISFIESSIFPIPPDVMLIPMVIAERAKAWLFATIATVTSVLGGVAGYAIGFFLFAAIGEPLLEFYGYLEKFQEFSGQYNEQGALIVFLFGVTPFPYKVITIASGATELNIAVFIAASVAARGLRFFLVCGLLYWLGPPIRTFVEKYLGWVALAFVTLLIGGFVALKYVF